MHGFLYLILGFKRGISEITGDLRYLRGGRVLRLQHIRHPDGGYMHSYVSTGGSKCCIVFLRVLPLA